ncbi:MAG: aminotransferase class V-fold PLP-dependent enzyme [Bacteroidales bacterium]|nr:aminotransferase class V-fold PLP-dependent enzyme [Bacteroidales bacterium]
MSKHWDFFKSGIVGNDVKYSTPYGEQRMIYADWIASGRLYAPIEEKISKEIGPYVANTHTETSESGTRMTKTYHRAQKIIKKHCNAGPDDVLITAGFGMTAVINKFQRILGFKSCGRLAHKSCLMEQERSVVFITHMEHHSNHTSWYSTNCDVVIVPPDKDLQVSVVNLRETLKKYENRPYKIGSFSAASNVTGIITPYHEMAKVMHEFGGLCFIDFAASAPYVDIDMHPKDPMMKLDAIFFSPHKFLGGPGASGVLIFDKHLYKNDIPDHPGGGTVDWTNAWGEYKFIDDIELREDGGTPGFLQTIRTALAIQLKEQMTIKAIAERENELVNKAIDGLCAIENVEVLSSKHRHRIGSVSFYHRSIHFNLIVKLLSDRYGIQVRGGCACAGTYGHILLDVDYERSKQITSKINSGDLSEKPGWVRLSIHPTMSNEDLDLIINAVKAISENYIEWSKDYRYSNKTNEFSYVGSNPIEETIENWLHL